MSILDNTFIYANSTEFVDLMTAPSTLTSGAFYPVWIAVIFFGLLILLKDQDLGLSVASLTAFLLSLILYPLELITASFIWIYGSVLAISGLYVLAKNL